MAGVTIELEGEPPALESFLTYLREQPPPLARIENVDCRIIPPKGESAFNIVGSQGEEERSVLISPDTPTCDDCLKELFDPADRRYRYPFINCTQLRSQIYHHQRRSLRSRAHDHGVF